MEVSTNEEFSFFVRLARERRGNGDWGSFAIAARMGSATISRILKDGPYGRMRTHLNSRNGFAVALGFEDWWKLVGAFEKSSGIPRPAGDPRMAQILREFPHRGDARAIIEHIAKVDASSLAGTLTLILSTDPAAQAAALRALAATNRDAFQKLAGMVNAVIESAEFKGEARAAEKPLTLTLTPAQQGEDRGEGQQEQPQTAGDAGAGTAGKIGPEESLPPGRVAAKKSQQQRPKK